ncbi:MAG TPA: hypothetical protein VHE35_30190, partial [Kofleriaceae bacterium]|nr:hypothetical protein [Kofleriaceae bacterium]
AEAADLPGDRVAFLCADADALPLAEATVAGALAPEAGVEIEAEVEVEAEAEAELAARPAPAPPLVAAELHRVLAPGAPFVRLPPA